MSNDFHSLREHFQRLFRNTGVHQLTLTHCVITTELMRAFVEAFNPKRDWPSRHAVTNPMNVVTLEFCNFGLVKPSVAMALCDSGHFTFRSLNFSDSMGHVDGLYFNALLDSYAFLNSNSVKWVSQWQRVELPLF